MNILVNEDREFGGVIRPFGGGPDWGVFLDRNPLREGPIEPEPGLSASRLLIWSGTPAEGLFEPDPRSWGAQAMRDMLEACVRLESTGRRVLIRPHARHVISDAPRCLGFLAASAGGSRGIILDAASMLDASMLPNATDHLTRIFESIGTVAEAVWLTGVGVSGSGNPEPVALGDGLVPAEVLVSNLKRCCPAETPVILAAGHAGEDMECLRRLGVLR